MNSSITQRESEASTINQAPAEPYSQVVDLLRAEGDAILGEATRLQCREVERAVELVASWPGKIVLVGVGKSGIIAQKIAATMISTGTAAVFLHPSDALHGGLGVVQGGDVVLALSNSGETDEVIAMLPYLR